MSASFQNKVTDIFDKKLHLSMDYLKKLDIEISQISLVGGVASNKFIYKKIKDTASNYNCTVNMPPHYMLSDNAAMIGWAFIKKYKNGFDPDLLFKPNPRLSINMN